MFTRPPTANSRPATRTFVQTGSVPIVVGQQSYAITFSPVFESTPSAFDPTVQMPNSSGEAFFATVDLSTLSPSGVTVWLSGIPTDASAGGMINWRAQL